MLAKLHQVPHLYPSRALLFKMRQSHVLLIIAYLKMTISRLEAIDFLEKDHRRNLMEKTSGPRDNSALRLIPAEVEEDSDNSRNWIPPVPGEFQGSKEHDGSQQTQDNLEARNLAAAPFRKLEALDDAELASFAEFLSKLLRRGDSWPGRFVLIEEQDLVEQSPTTIWNNFEHSPLLTNDGYQKRSRYYRRNSWKRQSSRYRNNYDYDVSRYLCTPTRQDVFELLVALHGVLQGDKERKVNFCNRWRTAGSIYTNVRFIGRK